ncbi:DUF2281 domain-containing protein [Candidatus Micrarchaeota archaeon]|nr:DUF2281 domain-containing protein [Candidatus Micrarchaeota archaeon]
MPPRRWAVVKEIEVKLQKLPEDLRREVLDFMEFLLKKYKDTKSKAKKFRFDKNLLEK